MSPEQAEGKPVDARSDVFSFGAVFYEMLAGAKAFDGDSSAALLAAVMRDDPKPVSELKRDVPAELRDIVARCLKKKPADRYASGAELAQELGRCREVLFPESGATLSPARILHEAKRPRVLIPLLALLILIGVGVGWLVQRNREVRWAREVALPQISRLYDQGKYGEAFRAGHRAENAIPGDPALAKLWPVISYEVTIDSTPEGADVYRREYGDPNAPWELVGKTPLKNVRAASRHVPVEGGEARIPNDFAHHAGDAETVVFARRRCPGNQHRAGRGFEDAVRHGAGFDGEVSEDTLHPWIRRPART